MDRIGTLWIGMESNQWRYPTLHIRLSLLSPVFVHTFNLKRSYLLSSNSSSLYTHRPFGSVLKYKWKGNLLPYPQWTFILLVLFCLHHISNISHSHPPCRHSLSLTHTHLHSHTCAFFKVSISAVLLPQSQILFFHTSRPVVPPEIILLQHSLFPINSTASALLVIPNVFCNLHNWKAKTLQKCLIYKENSLNLLKF